MLRKIRNTLALLGAIVVAYIVGIIVVAGMSVIFYILAGLAGSILVLAGVGIHKAYKSLKLKLKVSP